MSLIKCPECNNPVSDKAVFCPNCNCTICDENADLSNVIECEDCGNKFENILHNCPVCGCPASEKTMQRSNKKFKFMIVSIAVLILICVVMVGTANMKKSLLSVYNENMTETVFTILDGAVKSEEVGNLVVNVWGNAIHNRQDERTDIYTMMDGKFVDDFNDALSNLFADEQMNKNISEIRENQNEVLKLMKTLREPPKKYEEAYSVLKDYYENYINLTNSVISPNGSYNSFSEEFDKYDKEIMKSYDKMKLYLD